MQFLTQILLLHIWLMSGLRTNFARRLALPSSHALTSAQRLLASRHHSRVSTNVLCRSRAGLGRGYLCLACGPSAAFFIGHITKDYSNNGATNSFVPSENNRAVPGSLTFTFTFLFLLLLLFFPIDARRCESLCGRGYKNMMSISYTEFL